MKLHEKPFTKEWIADQHSKNQKLIEFMIIITIAVIITAIAV